MRHASHKNNFSEILEKNNNSINGRRNVKLCEVGNEAGVNLS